jgi:CheY-like chemotaxis protein
MLDALVVDDNHDLVDLICSMLKIYDVSGRPAYGSRSALLALQEKVPDVVFLDVHMPGFDGIEILSVIRKTPGCENLPVVMVTSDDHAETMNMAKEEGATTYIVKPINIELIESALKDIGLLS